MSSFVISSKVAWNLKEDIFKQDEGPFQCYGAQTLWDSQLSTQDGEVQSSLSEKVFEVEDYIKTSWLEPSLALASSLLSARSWNCNFIPSSDGQFA